MIEPGAEIPVTQPGDMPDSMRLKSLEEQNEQGQQPQQPVQNSKESLGDWFKRKFGIGQKPQA